MAEAGSAAADGPAEAAGGPRGRRPAQCRAVRLVLARRPGADRGGRGRRLPPGRLYRAACRSAAAAQGPGKAARHECRGPPARRFADRAGRSEEHTSELQSLMRISYAVFCLKKKNIIDVTLKSTH